MKLSSLCHTLRLCCPLLFRSHHLIFCITTHYVTSVKKSSNLQINTWTKRWLQAANKNFGQFHYMILEQLGVFSPAIPTANLPFLTYSTVHSKTAICEDRCILYRCVFLSMSILRPTYFFNHYDLISIMRLIISKNTV